MAIRVSVYGEANLKQIERARKELDRLEAGAKKNATGFKGAMGQMQSGVRGFMGDIRSNGPAAAAIIATIGIASWQAMQAASGLTEAESKAGVVFDQSAVAVKQWAKDTETSMGMSERAALEAAGTYGNLFRAIGLSSEVSADMSTTLVRLAGDLASFNNANPEDVLLALRSGLSGETEPLKQFGVALNDVRLKEEAVRLGLTDTTTGVLPQAIKTQAAYSLILKDTALAQTDFARTSDGMANQQRVLAASWEELTASVGQFLIEQGKAPEVMGRWSLFLQKLSAGDVKGAFFDDLNKEWRESAGATDEAQQAYDDANAALGDLKNQQGDATGVTNEFTGATGEASSATQKLTRDIHGLLVEQESLAGRTRSAKEAELDWRNAVLTAKDAHAQVAELRKAGKTGTDEYAKAVLAAEQADLRLADATNLAKEAEIEAARAYVKSKAGTENLSVSQDALAGKLAKATDRVQDLKYKLDTVPKEKRAEVKADIKDAEAKVRSLKRQIEALKDKTVEVRVVASGGGTMRAVVDGRLTRFIVNAAGGWYNQATAAIVGEASPDYGEYVINKDRAMKGDARQLGLISSLLHGLPGSKASTGPANYVDLRGASFGAGLTKAEVQGWINEVLAGKVRTAAGYAFGGR